MKQFSRYLNSVFYFIVGNCSVQFLVNVKTANCPQSSKYTIVCLFSNYVELQNYVKNNTFLQRKICNLLE